LEVEDEEFLRTSVEAIEVNRRKFENREREREREREARVLDWRKKNVEKVRNEMRRVLDLGARHRPEICGRPKYFATSGWGVVWTVENHRKMENIP
jgi:hypothetical protein